MIYKYLLWTTLIFIILSAASIALGSDSAAGVFSFLSLLTITSILFYSIYRFFKNVLSFRDSDSEIANSGHKNTDRYKLNDIKSHIIGKYEIDYMDREGSVTNRFISVYGCDGYYMYAFCSLRGAPRTFNMENVVRAIDIDTGEIITKMKKHITEKVINDPKNHVKTALTSMLPSVRILIYIAKADGRMMASERKIITDFIVKNSNGELDVTAVEDVIKRIEVPLKDQFFNIVDLFYKSNTEKFIEVFEYSKSIVATQKTAHPWETEALNYMESKLPSPLTPPLPSS